MKNYLFFFICMFWNNIWSGKVVWSTTLKESKKYLKNHQQKKALLLRMYLKAI